MTEYCSGGELFDRIIEQKKFSERNAASVISKVLSAVKHLHEIGIVHWDIKPENLLFEDSSPDAEIKLIDYGLSKRLEKENLLSTKVGTPFYVAPEILSGQYSFPCDLWSIGVLTYLMLCGYPPFYDEKEQSIFKKIWKCDLQFPREDWKNISEEAKDFVSKLLVKDPLLWISGADALNHPWIMSKSERPAIDMETLNRLKLFTSPWKFKWEVIQVITSMIASWDLKKIRQTFASIDTDSSGNISIDELKLALEKYGINEETEHLMRDLDYNGDGEINFSEFVAATIDWEAYMTTENLWVAFDHFDTDGDGQITPKTISKSFIWASKDMDEWEIEEMI